MTSPVDLHWVQRPGQGIAVVHRPATLEAALQLLADDESLQPLAGGTDLLLDLARSGSGGDVGLVDLSSVQGFRRIDVHPTAIELGGGCRHNDVVESPAINEHLLPLAQACLEVGSPQLRNRATIAGNLVTASPANDTISALMALDASLRIARLAVTGEVERRTVPVDEFFTGFRSTVLAPGELIETIVLPLATDIERRGVWIKLGLRAAQAISVVHAGIVVDFADDGTVADARIALGSVGPTVELNPAASNALAGQALVPETIAAAAQAAADSVTPIDDGRATAAYRSDGVATVIRRGLSALAANRERSTWPQRVPLLRTTSTATPTGPPAPAAIRANDEVAVEVNGRSVRGIPPAPATLLEWLREHAGTGTKEGCAEGECGACTVQLDGDAVMSCLVAAAQADSSTVRTVEGLAGDEPSAMQTSFVDQFAVQCGYCIPGFVLAATTLVSELPNPTRSEIELALSGNLCRCTGYYTIISAVEAAAAAGSQESP